MDGATSRALLVLAVGAALLLSGCSGTGSSPAASVDPEAPPVEQPVSVAAFLRDDDRFESLVELMTAGGVPGHDASFLEVIDAEADPGTLFAPTDAAFDALGSGIVEQMLDAPWLTAVVERHLAHGAHVSADLRPGLLQTWGVASNVTVEVDGDGRITYGGAQLIERDIRIGAWVVHVIDRVVLPSFVESELSS